MENNKMFNFTLLKNEFRKNTNYVSIAIILIIAIAVILSFGLFLKFSSDEVPDDASEQETILYEALESTDDWKEKYQIQMELNKTLEEFYGEDYVAMQNSLLQYKIDNDIAPKENGNNAFDFIKFSFSTLGFIIVILAALIFTQTLNIEYINKTEKLVYTKPFSRLQIFLSKYFVSVIFLVLLTFFWYLVSFVIGGALFGFEEFNGKSVIFFNHNIVETNVLIESLLNCLITFVNAFICGSIALAICSISHSRIAGIGAGLALFFIGKPITQKLFETGVVWVKYLPFSYTNFNMFMNSPLDSSFSIYIGIFADICLLAVLLLSSIIWLKKRDI